MTDERPRDGGVHPIVRLNFLVRLFACPLVVLIMLSARLSGGDGVSPALWVAALLYAIAWPHVAYSLSRRTGDANRELRLLLVDGSASGFAIALALFRPIPAMCLVIPVATLSASIGGVPLLVRGLGALAVAAIVTGACTGFEATTVTEPTAQITSLAALTMFQTMMGFFTFRSARAFVDSRRQVERQAEEIRRQNAELIEARESAMEAVKAKSAFLATMSHEIRTPLNGVLGMARLLAETPLTTEQQDLLRTVRTSGDTLVTVINDILDYSKVESGKLELEKEPLDVVAVVEESLEIVSDLARRKGIELVCEPASGVPGAVLGDATRLRQVVTNLVGNAVKFTESGEVVVRIRQLGPGTASGPATIEISVRDTGIGIPADRIPLLFTAFSQADTSTTRRYGGTGLGLAISRRLVALMGGDVSVESEPGRGSTFTFTIRADVTKDERPRATTIPAGGKRVLVVDDNATNRRALCGQLRLWGLEADEAAGAPAALAAMDGGDAYDLAILDYHMPDVDGLTLAAQMRARSGIPLVLLSSSLVLAKDDPGRLFSARLLKPARQSSLFDAIATSLGVESPRDESLSHGSGVVAPVSLRVLVADDNDINRDIARLVLRRFGSESDEVANGREAVDRVAHFAAGSDGTPYDLVLMDVHMPEMDGLEATRTIRRLQAERPAQKWPRIVAMTANAMQEDRATCLAAGMDDYLTKPLDFEEVGRVLRETASLPGGPAPSATSAASSAASASSSLVDWSRLDELAEYDTPEKTVVSGAIASLADQAPARLEEIRAGLASRDAELLRASAHRLKGAASNIGANALADCAARLEKAGRSSSFDEAGAAAAELATTLADTLRELTRYADGSPAPDQPERARWQTA